MTEIIIDIDDRIECKKCGVKMNIPKGHADLCYDCTEEVEA